MTVRALRPLLVSRLREREVEENGRRHGSRVRVYQVREDTDRPDALAADVVLLERDARTLARQMSRPLDAVFEESARSHGREILVRTLRERATSAREGT